MKVEKSSFGQLEDGSPVQLYTFTNNRGTRLSISDYGGTIVSLLVADRSGKLEEIVLGFDSVDGYRSPTYLKEGPYFGATIGRFGNRLDQGKFSLAGRHYQLGINNPPNHLHGGFQGFDKVMWQATVLTSEEEAGLQLRYISRDGEENYPGNLTVEVRYTLNHADELSISYAASTDQTTIINLTNHTYFNLGTSPKSDILSHELAIHAHHFLPITESQIPTGELQQVADTPFDFRMPAAIGSRINNDNEQLRYGKGYDHCWILLETEDSLKLAATLYDPQSGRFMEVLTTQPGLQFYSGNFLNGKLIGKNGLPFAYRSGLCLETQHYPDSPNHPHFPSVVLKPGDNFKSRTIYRFSSR